MEAVVLLFFLPVILLWLAGLIVPFVILSARIRAQQREIQRLGESLRHLRGESDRENSTLARQDTANASRTAHTASPSAHTAPEQTAAVPRPATEHTAANMPYAPYVSPVPSAPQARGASAPGQAESVVGRGVLGFAASFLVFIGLIFLGYLVYEHISESGKIALMFALSLAISGTGFALCTRKRNAFTVILTGCGFGSFFISVMLTHLYFQRIGDLAAYALLIVWMAAALFCARHFDSVTLSVIAHVGMTVSVCAAYAYSFSDSTLLPLFIYQIAAMALIIGGNILCCRKTYRFGVLASLLLTVIAGGFMQARLAFPPQAPACVVYALQFLSACFLAYLLTVSANRLPNKAAAGGFQTGGKLLWIGALFVHVCVPLHRSFGQASFDNDGTTAILRQEYYAVLVPVLCFLAAIGAHLALTVFMRRKLGLRKHLETISVALPGAAALVSMLVLYAAQYEADFAFPCLPYMLVPAVLLILAGRGARNRVYFIMTLIFVGADALLMISAGYESLTSSAALALSLGYLLLYPLVFYMLWLLTDSVEQTRLTVALKLSSYAVTQLSLIAVLVGTELAYGGVVLLLVLTAAHLILHWPPCTGGSAALRMVLWLCSLFWMATDTLVIAFTNKDATENVLYFLLLMLVSALAFVRLRDALSRGSTVGQILCGCKLTLLPLSFINGFTDWFAEAYVFSLLCMLSGLACVVLGFVCKAKTLRLYGLYLTLFCVLKLVTFDVSGLDTILRVVSLIGGGVICFAISALYSYSAKRLQAPQTE